MAVPHKPGSGFSLLRAGESARELLIGVGAGLIATALWPAAPRVFGAINPALAAMVEPIVAVPWWLSLPALFFAVFGVVSLVQKGRGAIISARVAQTVEPANDGMLEVDLRSAGGVALMKSMMSPQLWVYPRITSFAPYPLRVTHLTAKLSFGQLSLKLMLDQPFTIEPRSTRNDVCLSDTPDTDKVAKIVDFIDGPNAAGKILYVYIAITCESLGGTIDTSIAVERGEPEIRTIIR